MAKSSMIGIVYGAVSGTVRSIIVPDNDSQLRPPNTFSGPGEEMLVIAKMDLVGGEPDLAACTAAVEAHRGKPSASPRCAVVAKTGEVVSVILADPAIDIIKDHDLIRHDEAAAGWNLQADGVMIAPIEMDVIEARPLAEPPLL